MVNKKTTIKLESGNVFDCGLNEKSNLKKELVNGNPKLIVKATVNLLLSSDELIKDLSKETKKIRW